MNPPPHEPASRPRTAPAPPPLAAQAAGVVYAGFDSFHAQFQLVTRRARARFESRDWRGAQQDAVERLTLYRQFADWALRDLDRLMGDSARDPQIWAEMKRQFTRQVLARDDAEVAFTFFNSISRRTLSTVGVHPEQEYIDQDFQQATAVPAPPFHRTIPGGREFAPAVRVMLRELPIASLMKDMEGQVTRVARVLRDDLSRRGIDAFDSVDVLPALFYRNKGAYLIGRLRAGEEVIPLALPMVNEGDGVRVDAVLTTSDEVSIVFGFTRSYFHVEGGRPRAVIDFLRTIMPLKPLDELYTSIGYNKHGKTELYRALARHLAASDARFEIAEGDPGLVMCVFALPAFNVVFKIIKDRFGPPKNTTRRDVMDKYHLVFTRDRVGRLADAQEFEHLEFRRDRFAADLLEQLGAEAAGSVTVEGDRVIVSHLYTERRVTPLNLYLRQAEPDAALEAVLDYGQAIKDLAAANIFTGDMLLKNFGVTRHGRVIFYDYDELCLLTECRFRALPAARHEDDELSAEPWFYVGDKDVFPEEFRAFLVLPGPLGAAFLEAHGDLLGVEFWRRMQAMQEAGEVVDFFPYKPSRRLGRD